MLANLKFSHFGVAVKNLEKDLAYFESMGYKRCSEIVPDVDLGVRVVFLSAPNQPLLELVEDIERGKGPMSTHLAVNRRIFHLAYLSDDVKRDTSRLVEEFGATVLVPVCKGTTCDFASSLALKNRVIIELVQNPTYPSNVK